MLFEKVNISYFLNPLNSNTTNIVRDIFIISTGDTQKIPGHEKYCRCKNQFELCRKEY